MCARKAHSLVCVGWGDPGTCCGLTAEQFVAFFFLSCFCAFVRRCGWVVSYRQRRDFASVRLFVAAVSAFALLERFVIVLRQRFAWIEEFPFQPRSLQSWTVPPPTHQQRQLQLRLPQAIPLPSHKALPILGVRATRSQRRPSGTKRCVLTCCC